VPASRVIVRAIWATTRTDWLAVRVAAVEPRPASRRSRLRSTRRARRAERCRRESRCLRPRRGRTPGRADRALAASSGAVDLQQRPNASMPKAATTRPSRPPDQGSTRLSVRTWRTMRCWPAPSATRSAISFWRHSRGRGAGWRRWRSAIRRRAPRASSRSSAGRDHGGELGLQRTEDSLRAFRRHGRHVGVKAGV